MGHVYWEKKEIPIPNGGYVNHADGRVFIFLSDTVPTRQSRRMVIGHATSETTMHPNDNYRYYFPNLWEENYGESEKHEHSLRSGMYALSLGIGYKTGLYEDLQSAYGPMYANFLMDYAMYSMLERSDVAMDFRSRMKDSVLFSKEAKSDAWISDFFSYKLTESMNDEFHSKWLDRCRQNGITDAWLCIDGSNNDCEAKCCDLAQPGHAKSGSSGNIVSYMYAVTDDGLPLTYIVYNGGKNDSTAFQKLAVVLSDHDIRVKGVIVDRGFCTKAVVERLNQKGYPFVMMLTSNTTAYGEMIRSHAEDIRWKVRYASNKKSLFGISEKRRIFQEYPEEAHITLFYDGLNGAQRAARLIEKVVNERDKLEKAAARRKVAAVPESVRKYLGVKKDGAEIRVICHYDQWQADVDSKGFCAMASSMELTSGELDRIYHLRDASETQYAILKTQLGYDVTRSHTTEGIQNRFAACFVAAIIRSEIMKSCRGISNETSVMMRELDGIRLLLSQNGTYQAVHDESGKSKALLYEYGIRPEDFDFIADDVNNRLSGSIISQTRSLPPRREQGNGRKRGRPKKEKTEEQRPSRGPGRPKGSKNKKTLEAEKNANSQEQIQPRGPGRPKGSRNKPKTENVPEPKRGRGRPKGSKDKQPRKKRNERKESDIGE